jgi:hypothetical protein
MTTGRVTRVRTSAGTVAAVGGSTGSGVAVASYNINLSVVPANPTLFQQTITSANRTEIHRVDVYRGSVLLGSLSPTGGSVSGDFSTGPRLSLDCSFTPDAAALVVPGNELRPFSGFNYGSGPKDLLPLGQFPITATDIVFNQDIQVTPLDKYQWITGSTFLTPYTSPAGVQIRQILTSLVLGTGMWTAAQVTNTISSAAVAVAQTWDQDRGQAIADLCTAVGAEAYVSRTGQFILQNRRPRSTPVVSMVTGDGGRLTTAPKVTTDTSAVYNVVTIVPTNTDPAFVIPSVTVRITDTSNPAYPIPGRVLTRPYRLDGTQFTTTAQAVAAAQKVLTKISAKAEQIAITCHPDPSLDAGDTIQIVLPDGTVKVGQIQQITYPLNTRDDQQITTVSTRTDESFRP